ncbi:MAG: hypothetical protein HOW73_40405 [Polyangiaceae bacterium]|nr:hypothetical protein [Polyangiaceae bacterium]
MATFKARARALDMLGRQQIAGIPTAISELFKNAHDAYASRAFVDYYRNRQLFVLRDDGMGMTARDFEERWLSLGTESKLGRPEGISVPLADPTKRTRPVMGEKGIGRLAIAALGPQVLVLTRAASPQGADIVASFMHWGIFACPGLDLHEIEVPIETFPSAAIPTKLQITELVERFRKGLMRLTKRVDSGALARIVADVRSFDVDPAEYWGPKFTLRDKGHGTGFFIQPVDESLAADLEPSEFEAAPPLVKTLVGFTNSLNTDNSLNFQTAFYDHRSRDDVREIIRETEFFTSEDFEQADHRIIGEFDEHGAFKGTVTVYDQPPVPYELPWMRGEGKRAGCGSFSLRFAYVQGESQSTRLSPENHVQLTNKLLKVGGLYIYRDGIRVLPYGNSDFDFLDIEGRRSKNAARYFFSYRRMFGSIELARATNPFLEEKAGREGFRNNRAYREFRSILESFLVNLAADFFREGGERAQAWAETRAELERNARIRKQREEEAKAARGAFQKRLSEVLLHLDKKRPQREVREFVERAGVVLAAAARRTADGEAGALLNAEATLRHEFAEFQERYVVSKPAGFGLATTDREDWQAYRTELRAVQTKVFEPAARQIEQLVSEVAKQARLAVSQRRRAERALQESVADSTERVRAAASDVSAQLERTTAVVSAAVARAQRRVGQAIERTQRELATPTENEAGGPSRTARLRAHIGAVTESQLSRLGVLRDHLHSVEELGARRSPSALTEALEEELIGLREREELELSLVQLGSAVEIISHEFGASVKAVRRGIRRLKPWAEANAELAALYRDLRAAFEHLDAYLGLFVPLSRRLGSEATEVRGADVADYLTALFGERLARHRIELVVSSAFRSSGFRVQPAAIYAVFVNLMDNAIYWVSGVKGERRIYLEREGSSLLVRDTGRGVPERDHERIFARGFSRKTGGRGLGLYISRTALARAGYELSLGANEGGATFVIRPNEGQKKR